MESVSIENLQSELDFYRQNQAAVEQEIRTLIADNQKLSQQVGTLLKEKLQYAQESYDNKQSHELEDLSRQVAFLTKERDSLHVLWQTSQKTIEALDTELKTYQHYDNRVGKLNFKDENRELELKLETALSDYVELETNYKKISAECNNYESEIKHKERELLGFKEKCKDFEIKAEETKRALEEYKINLMAEKKTNEDIKNQLAMCQRDAIDRVKKEAEAKAKVAEALQLFDLVTVQKNEALKSIYEMTQEVTKLKLALASVKRETEESFKSELDDVKEKYNEKVTDMLEHVRNLDSELVEKGLLLNKALREIKILQTTNENMIKQQSENSKFVDPKLAIAEQKLETMFQELLCSERRNMQLVCEKQTLALDIQRIQDTFARETKRRDWEEKLLKTQCEELKIQVEHLQKSLNETHGMINKLQNMMSSRTQLSLKMVSTKEEELLELNKHLENQMELNKKWKESYLDMTDKLKKKLEALYKENKELRIQLNLPHSSSTDSINS
ncbi:CAP-Gly domain-containing linker protein 1-like isoform X1 [Pieris napi]|uniref:CAP-Gly domain-containing linker protein 1-like isoform X1 n=1 Tax=Pieris napi TaxID=78633 RepID=UPI001FBBE4F4|nr:CAP-Gly domain-containing linker protein 1-like isoform X1 [Pieris napi]